MIAIESDSWISNEKHEDGDKHGYKCCNVDQASWIEQSSTLDLLNAVMALLCGIVHHILVIKRELFMDFWVVGICDKASLSLEGERILWVTENSEDRFTRCRAEWSTKNMWRGFCITIEGHRCSRRCSVEPRWAGEGPRFFGRRGHGHL